MNTEKIIYVLDTNILLHEPFAFLSFKEHDVVVPMTVLEELDSIKDRRKDVSRDARVAIRALEDTLVNASPEEVLAGVKLPQNDDEHPSGCLSIFNDYTLEQKAGCLSFNENDNRIINAALYIQDKKAPCKVVLVTKDINMRLKAKGAGLAYVEDYRTDQLIDDIKFLTKGYHKFEGDFWDHVDECESETEGRNTTHYIKRDVLPNTYMNEYLIDEGDHFAGKVTGWDDEKLQIMEIGFGEAGAGSGVSSSLSASRKAAARKASKRSSLCVGRLFAATLLEVLPAAAAVRSLMAVVTVLAGRAGAKERGDLPGLCHRRLRCRRQ